MIRTITDGAGPATVRSNGVEVDYCFYADTETGEVRKHKYPFEKDANGDLVSVSEFLPGVTIENHFESKEAFEAHEVERKARGKKLLPENATTEDFMELLRDS